MSQLLPRGGQVQQLAQGIHRERQSQESYILVLVKSFHSFGVPESQTFDQGVEYTQQPRHSSFSESLALCTGKPQLDSPMQAGKQRYLLLLPRG